jgi:hypothetical protein
MHKMQIQPNQLSHAFTVTLALRNKTSLYHSRIYFASYSYILNLIGKYYAPTSPPHPPPDTQTPHE